MNVIAVNGTEFVHGPFNSSEEALEYATRCGFYKGFEIVELIKPLGEQTESARLADQAIKMQNDVNGNPRYYLPVFCFADSDGKFYRPRHCSKYRGKRFGAGWVFQSYNLESDLREAVK